MMFANVCEGRLALNHKGSLGSFSRLAVGVMVLLLTLMGGVKASYAGEDPARAVDIVIQNGDQLVGTYRAEDGLTSSDAFSDLYFDDFEGRGLEAAIALRDAQRKAALESRFSSLISMSAKGAPVDDVRTAWQQLRGELEHERSVFLASAGMDAWWPSFTAAFLILLREGAEALLVVAALVAYVQRSGEQKHMRMMYAAMVIAVVASLLTAWAIFTSVMGLDGYALEALEGGTMLVAAGVLAYVGHWLLSKRDAQRWQAYIHKHVDGAIASGSGISLAVAVFLAVYREGAETVLFYQALVIDQPGSVDAIVSGFALAVLVLSVLFAAIWLLGLRLPIKTFFTATAVLLAALAVVFVGKGMAALQVLRWVPATAWDGGPQVSWLGLFPTVEGLGAQAIILLAMILIGVSPSFKKAAS